MGIIDLVEIVGGMVLVATMEEAALAATVENQVLAGIREEMDLEEEIAEVGMASPVVRSAGEVVLALEAV